MNPQRGCPLHTLSSTAHHRSPPFASIRDQCGRDARARYSGQSERRVRACLDRLAADVISRPLRPPPLWRRRASVPTGGPRLRTPLSLARDDLDEPDVIIPGSPSPTHRAGTAPPSVRVTNLAGRHDSRLTPNIRGSSRIGLNALASTDQPFQSGPSPAGRLGLLVAVLPGSPGTRLAAGLGA